MMCCARLGRYCTAPENSSSGRQAGDFAQDLLVIHMFEYLVAESVRPILGPLLSPLVDIESSGNPVNRKLADQQA
jgi:hypothetical protein